VVSSSGGIAGFPNLRVPMLYQDMEMHFLFSSAKYQIQQQVMVLIQGQYLTKKLLGVN
jgi:hypothetical protein